MRVALHCGLWGGRGLTHRPVGAGPGCVCLGRVRKPFERALKSQIRGLFGIMFAAV